MNMEMNNTTQASTQKSTRARKSPILFLWSIDDGNYQPGFPFWPWHRHSIHPASAEYHVLPSLNPAITSVSGRYGDLSMATSVQRTIGSESTCFKATPLTQLTPSGKRRSDGYCQRRSVM